MTTQELNRDIKRLFIAIQKAVETANNSPKDSKAYYEYIEKVASKEFLRLYNADSSFKSLTRESILRMLSMNLSHRFVQLHSFGCLISI